MSRHSARFSALALVFSFAGFLAPSAMVFRVAGAGNMKGFGERLAQWYTRKNPAILFTVSGLRTSDAFAALTSGRAEIVQSARRPSHSEEEALRSTQGKKYLELQVATEVAAIAVNSSNPVKELSLFQLRQALSGEV